MVKNILKRKIKEEFNDGTKSECSSSLQHFSKRVKEASDQKRNIKSAPSSIAGHCRSPYDARMEDLSPPSGDRYNLAPYLPSLTSFGVFQPGLGTSSSMFPTATGWFSHFKQIDTFCMNSSSIEIFKLKTNHGFSFGFECFTKLLLSNESIQWRLFQIIDCAKTWTKRFDYKITVRNFEKNRW